jgi:hypothetical protein
MSVIRLTVEDSPFPQLEILIHDKLVAGCFWRSYLDAVPGFYQMRPCYVVQNHPDHSRRAPKTLPRHSTSCAPLRTVLCRRKSLRR